MNKGKTLMLAAGFVGGLAVGLAVGPALDHRGPEIATAPAAESQPAVASDTAAPKPAPRRATAARARVAVPASRPELHERLKPVLNRGADLTVASDGFKDAEQFALVAHAARIADVPFMVLKHRVLNEGKSVTAAIRDYNPQVDAAGAVNEARRQARSDVAAIAG